MLHCSSNTQSFTVEAPVRAQLSIGYVVLPREDARHGRRARPHGMAKPPADRAGGPGPRAGGPAENTERAGAQATTTSRNFLKKTSPQFLNTLRNIMATLRSDLDFEP